MLFTSIAVIRQTLPHKDALYARTDALFAFV